MFNIIIDMKKENEDVKKLIENNLQEFQALVDRINDDSFQNEKSRNSIAQSDNELSKLRHERIMDQSGKVYNLIDKTLDIKKMMIESKKIDLEVQRLRNELTQIILNHKNEMVVIESVFRERKMFFDQLFKVIDKGLVDGNSEFVHFGMSLANALINVNPLAIISDYSERKMVDLNNNKPLELNF